MIITSRNMIEEELHQSKEAEEYIRTHQGLLIETFASEKDYVSDVHPISLFMAGSPGAGKTEVSKRLIEKFKNKPVRIDADVIRDMFPGYTGANSHIFQSACTIGVNRLYDYVLHKGFNVILDGTFAYHGALINIERSIKRNRTVEIYYIYQDPIVAWEVTKKREALEHRNVSKQVFVDTFFRARENVEAAIKEFADKIILNLMIKDVSKNTEHAWLSIEHIDQFLEIGYTVDTLNEVLL